MIRANPAEYVKRYGSTLKKAQELPSFVLEIKPPAGVVLAADHHYNAYELEGDVQALRFIDLDREGLSEYKQLVKRLELGQNSSSSSSSNSSRRLDRHSPEATATYVSPTLTSATLSASSLDTLIAEIFNSIDKDQNGKISVREAEKVLLRLNSRLGRRYGEDDARRLFDQLDVNRDGFIDQFEFKKVFQSQL